MTRVRGKRSLRSAAPAAALLLAFAALPTFAVRPEPGPASGVSRQQSRHLPVREKSADQVAAASDAIRAGLRIQWDDGQGTPNRVRGNIPGPQKALSRGAGAGVAGDEGKALSVLAGVGRLFGFRDVSKEFRSRSAHSDRLGFRHVRMEQLHEGLRVVGGELIAHFDEAGKAYEVNGRYVTGLPATGPVRLPPPEAVRAAREDLLKAGVKSVQLVRDPELVVFAVGPAAALAYELRMRSGQPGVPDAWRCWVDAGSGEVLLRHSEWRTIAAPTANGAPATINGNMLAGEGGGATNVTGWRENGGIYYLHSTQRWWQVYNVAASGTYSDKGTYANRSVSDWAKTDRAEISLAHAFEKVQRYYFNMFGLSSFDGAGAMARANVHQGNNYVNAFWDPPSQQFYFGDGDGVEANPLAVLDIAGHEFSHAVTEYSAGLVYSYESGALDESFADISGACVEFLTQPDGRSAYGASPYHIDGYSDWLIGEDCWLSSAALRDMRSPANTATVGAGNERASRYLGRLWYSGTADNGGVHYNSGVQNFFFYLLSEGGSGVNDGVSYSVTGIGVSNAARVAYRALTAYCTPATDYNAVRGAWMSAAEDLNPAWVASVDSAWNAVGVGGLVISPDHGLTVAGPVGGPFSPVTRVYTLTNSGVMSLNWTATHAQPWLSVSPGSGVLPGGGGTNVAVALTSAMDTLAKGNYSDSLVFSNAASGAKVTLPVTARVGTKDYLTELFSAGDNDLDGYMLTFSPDAATTSYTAAAEAVADYPTDPSEGVPLSLSDDSSAQVLLPAGKRVRLFGIEYDRFHVGSNGYITFGAGDSDMSETLADHFDLPRISALFDDLDPAGLPNSQVTWKLCPDRVAVTYDNVPQYNTAAPNRMQVEMFFDGTIRIAYPDLRIQRTFDNIVGLAGLSPGGGVPAGFVESDLNSYGKPPAIRVAPQAVDFGVVEVGTTCDAVFTVTNAGECALQGSAAVSGFVSVFSGASYSLRPGTTHVVKVRYSPTSAGAHSNNVVFTGGGGASCAAVGRALGSGDQDGDGATDWEEYVAGTSLSDGNDYFRIRGSGLGTGGLAIRWNSVTGRWYTVWATTNLTGTWAGVHLTPGSGQEMSYTNPPSGASEEFLRVRVGQAP